MLKSNLFKLNKNRRYNYTPRYYRGKEEGNLYEFDSRFSKYRNTFNSNDFGNQWQDARVQMRTKKNRSISLRLLLIILSLVFVCLYILDFDLSIFTLPV
ncbi:hypothetical protein N9I27_02020 [Flavobacteriaceae bacterium]|jgi:hypothetical protein|nr:hypothetical protein [Flavobacteriaceae bacterium]MDA8849337.1 hypothetical protein [Flavobacteriaceae bacterium]MDB4062988.1 hypothetical protein [Flavobacteriaceae bacterium]MDC0001213.1 hypothetical protein [Flavobacteriaceae bacterium]MDC1392295.1 hypothetical protein [Flavobacteriaceae bacterium]|tara:strand:+ start:1174 stop:1470 length:297 start_codon:yes stop_codon:yes gene_type:complete